MPCWPDFWERAKQLLPLLVALASVIAYLALIGLLLWAPKLRKRWLRITSRVLGVAAIIPGAVILPAFLFGLALASGNPATQIRTVMSGDGQEARVRYDGGFLGRDYTAVDLKLTGSCRHTTVFWHGGPSSLDDVKIEWLDNRHLSLTYHARSGDQQHCEERVGEITIVCKSLGWPY